MIVGWPGAGSEVLNRHSQVADRAIPRFLGEYANRNYRRSLNAILLSLKPWARWRQAYRGPSR
jgi:hypothetical protein